MYQNTKNKFHKLKALAGVTISRVKKMADRYHLRLVSRNDQAQAAENGSTFNLDVFDHVNADPSILDNRGVSSNSSNSFEEHEFTFVIRIRLPRGA